MNNQEIEALLDKASRAIVLAEKTFEDSGLDFAAGRLYYAMFYIARALLLEKGLRRFTKHKAVHSAFGQCFSKTKVLDSKYHRWLINAFDKRVQGDYEAFSALTTEDIVEMIAQAREFLETARKYLLQTGTT
ncbi:MAG: HEPN domain-containing protein [Candidatus Omnitrophica bacterium]|nr:HEPN domain-containing protein [Candidatus Omnitrophota bacterium]